MESKILHTLALEYLKSKTDISKLTPREFYIQYSEVYNQLQECDSQEENNIVKASLDAFLSDND